MTKVKFKDAHTEEIYEPSVIALIILASTKQDYSTTEQAFFVAGFEEAVKFMVKKDIKFSQESEVNND